MPNSSMGLLVRRPRLANFRFLVTLFFTASFGLTMLVVCPCRAARARGTQQLNAAATAPTLLTQTNSSRAIAIESVTSRSEPFPPTEPILFGTDNRTRVMLFATNLTLNPGENASAVTGDAEDAAHAHYPLTVEYVGAVTGFEWMSSVVVRLNDSLGDVGDVLVGITIHGATSNR